VLFRSSDARRLDTFTGTDCTGLRSCVARKETVRCTDFGEHARAGMRSRIGALREANLVLSLVNPSRKRYLDCVIRANVTENIYR
jgi:hypothetical protein